MATEPYLGEINLVSFNFAPRGWALCNGQLLPINQNQALFSILGTTYGGDGRVTFALPNLQARTPLGFSSPIPLGVSGGTSSETITSAHLPPHSHAAMASGDFANTPNPAGRLLGAKTRGGANVFVAPGSMTPLAPDSIGQSGGNQPHNNMQPYLVLNFIIALQGIFPSQN